MSRYGFVIVVLSFPSLVAAFEPGDQLVVTRPSEMKTITGGTFQLTTGSTVTVRLVEGDQLKVAAPRVGWIGSSGVIPAKQAEDFFSQQVEKGSDKSAA